MSDILKDAVMTAIGAVASSLPSLSRVMEADGATATVVYTSGIDMGIGAATSSGANETARIVAQVVDFPDLSVRSLVSLDGVPHIITSLRKTGEAAWFAGISEPMNEAAVAFYGVREDGSGGARSFEFSVASLVSRGDESYSLAEAYAPSASDTYHVVVRENEWPDATPPEIGDRIEFFHDGRTVVAKAANVERHRGYTVIMARSR